MRLSDAMRLGAMAKPQAFGTFSRQRRKFVFFGPIVGKTCAIGAAYDAIGGRFTEKPATEDSIAFRGSVKQGQVSKVYETPPEWHAVLWQGAMCPVCAKSDTIQQLIPHLNDQHRWTRESIADWVATFETPTVDAETLSPSVELASKG